jgi:hypothetical protein
MPKPPFSDAENRRTIILGLLEKPLLGDEVSPKA